VLYMFQCSYVHGYTYIFPTRTCLMKKHACMFCDLLSMKETCFESRGLAEVMLDTERSIIQHLKLILRQWGWLK